MIRVLIAAYSGLAADAFGTVLQSQEDMSVIGRACSAQEVAALLPLCDVLLITPELQHGDVFEVIRCARLNQPTVKTIIAGIDEDAETLEQYLQAGANAYVLGSAPVYALMRKVRGAR